MPLYRKGIAEYSQNKIKQSTGRTEARFFQFGANTGRSRFERPSRSRQDPQHLDAQASRFCPQPDAQAWRLGTIRPCKHGVWLSKHALVRVSPETLRKQRTHPYGQALAPLHRAMVTNTRAASPPHNHCTIPAPIRQDKDLDPQENNGARSMPFPDNQCDRDVTQQGNIIVPQNAGFYKCIWFLLRQGKDLEQSVFKEKQC